METIILVDVGGIIIILTEGSRKWICLGEITFLRKQINKKQLLCPRLLSLKLNGIIPVLKY